LKRYVLDASVALKWAAASASETLSSESLELLRQYVNGVVNFIVPDIFWSEVCNVLWKGSRQSRWSQAAAGRIISEMHVRNFATVSPHSLMNGALRIAFTYYRTVYDCLYVALAIRSGTHMITADERLANSVDAYLPVRWLGAL
jgi:predicted nucleic acid-binding protein